MFGVVQCTACRRPRVVDLTVKQSTCPFCSNRDGVQNLRVVVKCRTEANARDALQKLTVGRIAPGFDNQPLDTRKKHAKSSTDPWSSLEYEYENAKGIEEKLEVMSKGLTSVCGEFTEDDVLALDPKNGRKYLVLMLERCIVHEVGFGRYKA